MEDRDELHNGTKNGTSGGILYPVMLIAALAVIVFSVVGIATMTGLLPKALSQSEPVATEREAAGLESMPRDAPAAPVARRSGRSEAYAGRAVAALPCQNCGVVESIRAVEAKGQGSGLGAIGGAVVGGILGNQIGHGRGRTAATVVGAGAGAYAGHEIERNVKRHTSFQVRVRMDDGTLRTFYEPAHPPYSIGQKVRVGEQGVTGPAS